MTTTTENVDPERIWANPNVSKLAGNWLSGTATLSQKNLLASVLGVRPDFKRAPTSPTTQKFADRARRLSADVTPKQR